MVLIPLPVFFSCACITLVRVHTDDFFKGLGRTGVVWLC